MLRTNEYRIVINEHRFLKYGKLKRPRFLFTFKFAIKSGNLMM